MQKNHGKKAVTTLTKERLEEGSTIDSFWAIEEIVVEDVLESTKSAESLCKRLHGAIKNTSRFVSLDGYNNATSQCRPARSI